MTKDFIELFEPIQDLEVSETALFSIIKEAHSLIETKNFNSVPNTLRKFYECLLYKCKDELIDIVDSNKCKTLFMSSGPSK